MSLERKLAKGFVRSLSQMERSRVRNAKASSRELAARQKQMEREEKARERERLRAGKKRDKLEKQQYIASQKEEVEFNNETLQDELSELESILEATLEVDDYFDLNNLKKTEALFPFENKELETPLVVPEKPVTPEEPQYTEPKRAFTLFGRKKKHQVQVAEAQKKHKSLHSEWIADSKRTVAKYEKACDDYAEGERLRLENLEAARKQYCVELEKHNAEVDKFIDFFAYGDKSAVEDYISIVMDNSRYPEGFKVTYTPDFDPALGELSIKVTIPKPSRLNTIKAYKYIQSRDEVTFTNVSKAELKRRYLSIVNQVCLRTMHEIFESDRKPIINSASITVGTIAHDAATGLERFIVLAGLTSSREDFEQIDLSSIEPAATMKHLKAAVSKNPYELVEVDVSGVRKAL